MEIIKNTILIKYPMIFSKKMKDAISYFEWNILSELVVQANHIVDTFNMWSAAFISIQEHLDEIDLDLELLVKSGYYDEATNDLVLVLANSSEIRIPVGNLLTDLDAHNIRFNGSGTNHLTSKTEVEGAIKELDTQLYIIDQDKVDKIEVETMVGDRYTKAEVLSLLSILNEKIVRLEESLNWSVNLLELIDSLCWTDTCTGALETDLIDALCWTGTCENAGSSNLVFSLQWT